MMEYQLDGLRMAEIAECTIVVGYMADSVRSHFGANYRGMKLSYLENKAYDSTNNLYSLWLARAEFDDDILLLESDLVFDNELISELTLMDQPNVAVVDKFQPNMDGTIILAAGGTTKQMVLKSDQGSHFDYGRALKTVNIYRLSQGTLVETIVPKMAEFLQNEQTDQYYEAVFANLIDSGNMSMAVMNTGRRKWAEIDTMGDLKDAERMFAAPTVRWRSEPARSAHAAVVR